MHEDYHGRASWEGTASGYGAGGKVDGVRPDGNRHVICKLSGHRGKRAAERPTHVGVSMWYRTPARPWAGTLDVVGTASWSTGRGTADAEFDVSAWGTQLSLTGGADFVELGCRATGTAEYIDGQQTEPVALSVQAMISVGDVGHVPATRTREHIMPGDAGAILRIPNFARAVYLLTTVPNNVANVDLVVLADDNPLGAPVILAQVPWATSTRIVVPLGAHHFTYVRGAGAWQPSRVRSVWELAL